MVWSFRWVVLAAALGGPAAAQFPSVAPELPRQTVNAPGSVKPNPPLTRYVYNVVAADFAKPEGPPLVKSKFNLYDPVGPTTAQFDAAIAKMGELKVDTYRIELGWGRRRSGFNTHVGVGGTAAQLKYDFSAIDHMVKLLDGQHVQFLASYSYTPPPLQDPSLPDRAPDGKVRETTPPREPARFAEAAAAFAAHARSNGIPFGIHEVWNEPDGTYQFFSGTADQYNELFKATAQRLRAEDPHAVIAGPASDHHMIYSRGFIDYVARNKLPLDQYSFHEYGSGELAVRQIDRATASLNRYPQLARTALSLDEWHDGECCEWCADDNRNHYPAAPELLHDFDLLLHKPELASVSWAWWLDPPSRGAGCMGLITGDGRRKAVFNAWKLYAMMPIDRKAVRMEGPLEAMASSDAHRAGLLIWNRTAYLRRFDAVLDRLPFERGTVRIYRIDAKHASATDGAPEQLEVTETYPLSNRNFAWVDTNIPPNGVVYVEASDDSAVDDTPVDVAKVVRIDRYYPERGRTRSYADFDRRSWTARLGMEGSARADQEIGVLADGLPDALDITASADAPLRRVGANSLLGVRVDYMVGDRYVSSALYHGPLGGVDLDGGRRPSAPFGTERRPDRTRRVADFAAFSVPLRADAPPGWTGKASISFILQDAGPEARVKIMARRSRG